MKLYLIGLIISVTKTVSCQVTKKTTKGGGVIIPVKPFQIWNVHNDRTWRRTVAGSLSRSTVKNPFQTNNNNMNK